MKKEVFILNKPQVAEFKQKASAWAADLRPLCILDSNEDSQYQQTSFEWALAAGAWDEISLPLGTAQPFERWQQWSEQSASWQFGFLGYELKDSLENLRSAQPDRLAMPVLYFFRPLYLLFIYDNQTVEIQSDTQNPSEIWGQIWEKAADELISNIAFYIGKIQPRIAKKDYLNTVEAIRQHIVEGDIYELNFCQEFFVENADIQPFSLFERLNKIAKTPFAAYLETAQHAVCCASPERYLRKEGNSLYSQPIKGTRKRSQVAEIDEIIKQELLHSEKDRAENVMIVDLVRNDLSRVSRLGSVQVEELCALYGFRSVWQLISTIKSELLPNKSWLDAIKCSFPMGSMTGAPKVAAMQLAEIYERSRRGLYSGALGYVSPSGNFDFNVLIRSFLYDKKSRYLSWQVGGAIVYDSQPEDEYEECWVKMRPLLLALGLSECEQSQLFDR